MNQEQLSEMASAIVSMRADAEHLVTENIECDDATWERCRQLVNEIKAETAVDVSIEEVAGMLLLQGMTAIHEDPEAMAWVVNELRKLEQDKPSRRN